MKSVIVYTCATAVVILVPPLAPNTIAGRIFESVKPETCSFTTKQEVYNCQNLIEKGWVAKYGWVAM
jgi:hypothetical protein